MTVRQESDQHARARAQQQAGPTASARAVEALPPAARVLLTLALLAVFGGLALAVLSLSEPAPGLAAAVAERIDESGVSHPVTAVLLNFRGYDTLLELVVLVLAVMGAWSVGRARVCAGNAPGPLLRQLPRLLAPLMVLVAGYLLWVGAHAPGGAFQAGSLLGGVGILLCLSGHPLPRRASGLALRLVTVLGVAVFAALGVAAGLLPGGAPLDWPPAQAKTLILTIELAAMLSIGVVLAALFAGGRP
ncbi:MAG: MnhB domain-containing protein [Thiohalocapsa sp.]|jgi:multisubunit Na+/H+ antiporter MnhB subunit